MRVTIVPSEGLVAIDGFGIRGIDISSIPENVHALQWYGTHGSVEILAADGIRIERNEDITSLQPYEAVLAAFTARKLELEQAAATEAEEQDINEV